MGQARDGDQLSVRARPVLGREVVYPPLRFILLHTSHAVKTRIGIILVFNFASQIAAKLQPHQLCYCDSSQAGCMPACLFAFPFFKNKMLNQEQQNNS